MTKKKLLEWITRGISYNEKWNSKSEWMDGYCKGQINILNQLKEAINYPTFPVRKTT